MSLPSPPVDSSPLPTEATDDGSSRSGMVGFLLGALGGVRPFAGRLAVRFGWRRWRWPGVILVTVAALAVAVTVSLPGLRSSSSEGPAAAPEAEVW